MRSLKISSFRNAYIVLTSTVSIVTIGYLLVGWHRRRAGGRRRGRSSAQRRAGRQRDPPLLRPCGDRQVRHAARALPEGSALSAPGRNEDDARPQPDPAPPLRPRRDDPAGPCRSHRRHAPDRERDRGGQICSPTLELAFKIAAVFEKPLGEVFHYEEEQLGNSRSSGSTHGSGHLQGLDVGGILALRTRSPAAPRTPGARARYQRQRFQQLFFSTRNRLRREGRSTVEALSNEWFSKRRGEERWRFRRPLHSGTSNNRRSIRTKTGGRQRRR